MKSQFLKLAGVKTEKEFYDKFPTEEAFMAKYGKSLKKAQNGIQFNDNAAGVGTGAGALGMGLGAQGFGQETPGGGGNMMGMMNNMNVVGKVGAGIKALKAEKAARRQAQQTSNVSEMSLRALRSDNSADEVARMRQDMYVRPEDNIVTGEELFPVYGVGTNVLAKKGKTLKNAQYGNMMSGPFNQATGALAGSVHKNSGGAQIGGAVADMVPIAGGALKPFFELAGDAVFSRKNRRLTEDAQAATSRDVNNMTGFNMGSQLKKNFSPNMQDGGTLSGDVKPLWGGNVETMSYNPYAPGDGTTSMITGKSHTKGGVGLQYGNNTVEAEGQEPIVQMEHGGEMDKSVAIMGNLPLPKGFTKAVEETTGEKIKGGKFKTFTKNLGELENKQTKKIDKNVSKAEDYTPLNKLDRISLNTLKVNIEDIYTPKLKSLQEAKEGAALLQQSINETAEEYNLNPDKLASGKIKKAKNGKKMGYAQNGENVYETLEAAQAAGYELQDDGKLRKTKQEGTEPWTATIKEAVPPMSGITPGSSGEVVKSADNLMSDEDWNAYLAKETPEQKANRQAREQKQGLRRGYVPPSITTIPGQEAVMEQHGGLQPIYDYATINSDKEAEQDPKKKMAFNIMGALSQVPQFFRNTDAEPFDNRQLIPEMWAMSNNALEPVDAQKYQPRLDVPYDISFQDMRNQNQSDYRAGLRTLGNNQGLAGNLQAQKYMANQKVNAEEFRQNQAMKNQVYSKNRDTLNDADLKNLAIMDTQAQRQAKAKSTTKATALEAIKSVTDKIAKHSLENKTLRVWENMYDYRYDKAGRANYQGPPVDFSNWDNGTGMGAGQAPAGYDYVYGRDGRPLLNPDGTPRLIRKSASSGSGNTSMDGSPSNQPGLAISRMGSIVKKYKKY